MELGQLLVGRFLGLLNQIRVSGRAAPSVRFGEGGAVRPAGSGIEVVPIHLAGTCADPRFGVDAETFAPETVLLRRVAGFAPFFGQFFADGADVVRLEAAAAADVTHAHVVGAASVMMHVPARADARFESEGELGKIDEALLAGVGRVVGQRLRNVVRLKTGFFDAVDDELHGVQSDEGIVVTVDADDIGAGLDHSGAAFFGGDAVEISFGADAETAGDRKRGFLADLDGPLRLFDVLEVLAEEEVDALLDESVDLLAKLGLDGFFAFAA